MTEEELDIGQLEEAAPDPTKKAEFAKKLKPFIYKVGDENSSHFEVFRIKDLIASSAFLSLPAQPDSSSYRPRDVRAMSVRDDDVFVISYPKSGTHWTCNLLRYILMTGPLEETTSYQPSLVDIYPPVEIEAIPSPRVLATHLKPSLVPRDLHQGKGRVVMVYRNPKDTAVSYFYQMKRIHLSGKPCDLPWDVFIDNWIKGVLPPSGYFDFHKAWDELWDTRKDLKVLLVCYENLKQNPLREVKRMSEHLGMLNSEERLQQIIEKCSINNLRSDVETGKVKSPLVDKDGKSVLYRKGEIGDWKNHFTVAQNEMIDSEINTQMKDSVFKPKV